MPCEGHLHEGTCSQQGLTLCLHLPVPRLTWPCQCCLPTKHLATAVQQTGCQLHWWDIGQAPFVGSCFSNLSLGPCCSSMTDGCWKSLQALVGSVAIGVWSTDRAVSCSHLHNACLTVRGGGLLACPICPGWQYQVLRWRANMHMFDIPTVPTSACPGHCVMLLRTSGSTQLPPELAEVQ